MVDVVLPVLNEAQALPQVLAAMPRGYHPIVVDNGSDDGSGDVARELGATVVDEPRKGFGAACFTGLVAAQRDVVCFMDCDGSLDPRDLPRVADPVGAGEADLVLAARMIEKGAMPPHARVANRALAFELRRRTSTRLTDLGPMRAARRQQLLDLGIQDRRFGWPLEMVLRAAAADWRIQEVRVPYRPRAGGESKVSGSVRGTLRAVRDMRSVFAER
ncbi:MAG TPA: glycosyltransferase family 2 protein [Solirubrobacteraceae bacterium]|nr:glycosyltransferase family 2 protein [Solirubrobacteraceae bacterium]